MSPLACNLFKVSNSFVLGLPTAGNRAKLRVLSKSTAIILPLLKPIHPFLEPETNSGPPHGPLPPFFLSSIKGGGHTASLETEAGLLSFGCKVQLKEPTATPGERPQGPGRGML